ncbi:PREDICTED: uncharacterized protein LOC108569241 [Nicrophorus vespilloides]|uniref:Uncharacterized protein LOC108569241 n=1 Tax=Nicrophorus vespilloides TaxID=110193 RepID=A0ABM1NHA5_NICVS|nr:PREDICTED: uncharacterized protein LOC108569241 [Nicrophorus vespilloides]
MMSSKIALVPVFVLLLLLVNVESIRHPRSNSILDMINTKEVERLIAERRENEERKERTYLIENELDETYTPPDYDFEYKRVNIDETTDNPRVDVDLFLKRNNHTEPYTANDLLADLRGYKGRKVLKSSKNALLITKKEYLQRDWCKTEPLIQKIKEDGCLPRTIINKFCYGQCNSFYIPKNPKKRNKRKYSSETEDEDLNGPAFKSCGFCKPKKFTWITVTLRCPNSTPRFRKKRIQRIKQCKCIAADLD